ETMMVSVTLMPMLTSEISAIGATSRRSASASSRRLAHSAFSAVTKVGFVLACAGELDISKTLVRALRTEAPVAPQGQALGPAVLRFFQGWVQSTLEPGLKRCRVRR